MGKMSEIVVVPYDSAWPGLFEQEASIIATIFGRGLIAIHHIGSTAVPGLSAKPIIDLMPVVRHLEHVDAFNPGLMRLGYEPKGENGIPGRRYFVKGGDASRTHHVHTYEADHPEVARHLDFRDYLIAHPAEARRYAQLKVALSGQYPHDIEGYMAGKDGFIRETIALAHKWRARLEGPKATDSA